MAVRKAAFGGPRIGGVLFDEDFAANEVESGVEPMLSGLVRERQRLIDRGEGGFRGVWCLDFDSASSPR